MYDTDGGGYQIRWMHLYSSGKAKAWDWSGNSYEDPRCSKSNKVTKKDLKGYKPKWDSKIEQWTQYLDTTNLRDKPTTPYYTSFGDDGVEPARRPEGGYYSPQITARFWFVSFFYLSLSYVVLSCGSSSHFLSASIPSVM
jgi:hypothetical protein